MHWTCRIPDIDGVATVDVVALAAVLRASGPVPIDGYGQVDADNVNGCSSLTLTVTTSSWRTGKRAPTGAECRAPGGSDRSAPRPEGADARCLGALEGRSG